MLEASYATRWRAHKEMRDNGVDARSRAHRQGQARERTSTPHRFPQPARRTDIVEHEDDNYEVDDLRAI